MEAQGPVSATVSIPSRFLRALFGFHPYAETQEKARYALLAVFASILETNWALDHMHGLVLREAHTARARSLEGIVHLRSVFWENRPPS